jgi:hypothetical protein
MGAGMDFLQGLDGNLGVHVTDRSAVVETAVFGPQWSRKTEEHYDSIGVVVPSVLPVPLPCPF